MEYNCGNVSGGFCGAERNNEDRTSWLSGERGLGDVAMTDVFKRTAQVLEKERQLLDRDAALFGPLEAPVEDIPPVAIDHADLVTANANFQPGSLPPETRRRRLKETVLRLISVYSSGQVTFNASVVRILNGWDGRLSMLAAEITDRLHTVQERTNIRFSLVELRRNVWESRFTGEMHSLRNRMTELETDLAEAQLRLEEQQARVAQLEKELANAPASAKVPTPASAAR